jgi:hypothetical protein
MVAKWAIVYFGHLFKILEVTHIFGLIYSTVKVTYALILWKTVLGYTLGDFLTSSSGRPGRMEEGT